MVRVNTPGGEFNAPLGSGDQTNPENWTTFDLPLEEGEMLVISVMEGTNPLVIGECTVQGATELHYARAIAFYFAPPNNYINCATGFTSPLHDIEAAWGRATTNRTVPGESIDTGKARERVR